MKLEVRNDMSCSVRNYLMFVMQCSNYTPVLVFHFPFIPDMRKLSIFILDVVLPQYLVIYSECISHHKTSPLYNTTLGPGDYG